MATEHRFRGEHHDQSLHPASKRPSTPQLLAVATLFPLGGFLLCVSGLILAGTIIGLALATPLFVIFSPVLVPAVIAISLAVAGFLTSGAFGITALSAVSWIINYMRRARGSMAEHARWSAQDTTGHIGQKAKEVGQRTQDVMRP